MSHITLKLHLPKLLFGRNLVSNISTNSMFQKSTILEPFWCRFNAILGNINIIITFNITKLSNFRKKVPNISYQSFKIFCIPIRKLHFQFQDYYRLKISILQIKTEPKSIRKLSFMHLLSRIQKEIHVLYYFFYNY